MFTRAVVWRAAQCSHCRRLQQQMNLVALAESPLADCLCAPVGCYCSPRCCYSACHCCSPCCSRIPLTTAVALNAAIDMFSAVVVIAAAALFASAACIAAPYPSLLLYPLLQPRSSRSVSVGQQIAVSLVHAIEPTESPCMHIGGLSFLGWHRQISTPAAAGCLSSTKECHSVYALSQLMGDSRSPKSQAYCTLNPRSFSKTLRHSGHPCHHRAVTSAVLRQPRQQQL